MMCIKLFLAKEIIDACTGCTGRGYHFYRTAHPTMNETFVCFDNRHLMRPETQVIDFALNPKECDTFPSRVNIIKASSDVKYISGKEMGIILEMGKIISKKIGYDGCLPPLIGISLLFYLLAYFVLIDNNMTTFHVSGFICGVLGAFAGPRVYELVKGYLIQKPRHETIPV